jgi:hypothetical protein
MPFWTIEDMHSHTIGLALIVGGAALLCGGLIFLLPVRRRRSTVEEDTAAVERSLTRARRARGEL